MITRFEAVVVPLTRISDNTNLSSTHRLTTEELVDNRNGARMSSSRRRSTRFSTKTEQHDNGHDQILDLTSGNPAVNGRASTASASTVGDSADASGYTTPLTSGVPTPIPSDKQDLAPSITLIPPIRRRARPANSVDDVPESHKRAFAKARKAREVKAQAKAGPSKQKRLLSDDESDLTDLDADSRLARALQESEYAKLDSMDVDSESDVPLSIGRKGKRILSHTKTSSTFVVPDSDVDLDTDSESEFEVDLKPIGRKKKMISRQPAKRIKLEVRDSAAESSDVHVSDDEVSTFKVRGKNEIPDTADAKPIVKFKGKSAIKRESLDEPQSESLITTTVKRESTIDTLDTLDTLDTIDSLSSAYTEAAPDAAAASDDEDVPDATATVARLPRVDRRSRRELNLERRAQNDRLRLEKHHPELLTMWEDLKNLPVIKSNKADQPKNINRQLKPFQLEGLSWMQEMEKTAWGGGLLGDEMGMGKTIQAVSLIMSDWPAKTPSLVLMPPVALMQWQQEIGEYTDGTLKVFVFHGTNKATKGVTVKELSKYDVILVSYNSLESMHRFEVSGRRRKVDGVDKMVFQKSVMHQIQFHRVILDEAHSIKSRQTGVARACFALKADHKWCLSGTPLQNRIGEFFSLVRFLDIRPFACYFCKQCPCSTLNWGMDASNKCKDCSHHGMQHVSVFNQELLNPIQKYGNKGLGKIAFDKLRLLTDRFMLRRVKRDHSSAMELPSKEIIVNRQFFGEVENDFAGSIMNNNVRKFETYVAQGVMLNNYANIFGLIMQMRQVANHPDLILKKSSEGGANILHCCVCDEVAEDAIRSNCKHDFCRECAKNYTATMEKSGLDIECPRCHIGLAIDLEQPAMEQNETDVKKNSIINRIKMENWTSSSKIEALVHELHSLRSNKGSSKSIIFSQFSTMLQLVEWRLRRAGITTVMLDGSMTPSQRQASINKFMTDTNIECFLVSLKAGGVALNLTEASKVFLIDPWWNPAAEWQSADRCHRIGQARPCTITRLCIEDSVESRMVQLQEKKANMINSTINSDESAMESLTPEDMQFLFRGT